MAVLLLPGMPGFLETLASPPPMAKQGNHFVCRAGTDVLEEVNHADLNEYLEGGEYEERMAEIGSDILWLPEEIEIEF